MVHVVYAPQFIRNFMMSGPATRNSPNAADSSEISALLKDLKGDSKKIVTIMMKQFQTLRDDISSKNEEITQLKSAVSELKNKVEKLESNIDDADAYERRDTVILSGSAVPPASVGEKSSEIALAVVRQNLRIELSSAEINTAHRLGRKAQSQAPDTRPIIIKLCRRDVKTQLMTAARQQRSSSLYINESLTPPRRKILFVLRQMKRAHPDLVLGCNSYDGKIYAYTKGSVPTRNTRHLVNTYQSLVKFCNDQIKVPIQTFLDQWEY